MEDDSKGAVGLDLIPQLSLDCVIFGFHDGLLKILLLRWKETEEWSLPGGIVLQRESVDDAANRVLMERTGLTEIFLKQFHTFGDLHRYDKKELQDKLGHVISTEHWYDRAVSIGYFALVDYAMVFPNPDKYTDECKWVDLKEVPKLLFDHNAILEKAIQSLRRELSFQPLGYNLLPEKFTMPELMRLYEAVLDKKIDPRNFQKKILKSGIVIRLEEVKRGLAHKSPFLYRFDKERYEEVLEDGGLFFV
ncbi:hypothetical protein P872_19890 [Rhodonellum psychrophilum GCM71 = DSM 17998]|uniref:Nudix hydrolase domain-containing protein n=2 Tax=Rhodonellum TaxID=336827 RepID=U5BVN2_9BACT|nr:MULTISPECIES: NUDIX domain-containing protein [Rhodonellum]ERM81619.1 hypothetical protein P872_19890 [Rhodonellum psychrophilum GCM71 = DSM 17998]SDZ33490.1 ADP-ribose pyrophosphatase YjhB, NUDIX family [Rhodonellum ikkaensis]